VGLSASELEGLGLWTSKPASWRSGLAWGAHALLIIALTGLVVALALTNARLAREDEWARSVIVGGLEAQGLKLLVLEPAAALAMPLLLALLRCLPEDVAIKLVDGVVNPWLGFARRLRELIPCC
jgi:hypothetical protein